MGEEQYINFILQALPQAEAVSCSEDDEDIGALESEMMKYGSLHADSMNWDMIEKTSLKVLAEKCKSLRVLSYLLLALQTRRDAASYLMSLSILSGFLQAFWVDSYPMPGDKGLSRKRKMLRQIMTRTEQASEKLRLTEADSELPDKLDKALTSLENEMRTTGFTYQDYDLIRSNCKQQLNSLSAPAPRVESANTVKSSSTLSNSSASNGEQIAVAADLGDIRIDSAGERESKQSLFKVASFLCGLDADEALGYRLRRYALWYTISSLPPAKENVTEMMAVPADKVAEYSEQLEKPTSELQDRLESSIAASPFWITGNYLASRVALGLSRPQVAQAILEETQKFITRLPKVSEYSFSDGTPFVDEDTAGWLSGSKEAGAGGGHATWNEALERALKAAKKGDFKQGLALLEAGLAKAADLREQSYWRLVSADFLSKTGMKTLGQSKYLALAEQIKDMDMSTWEPAFAKHLSDRLPKGLL